MVPGPVVLGNRPGGAVVSRRAGHIVDPRVLRGRVLLTPAKPGILGVRHDDLLVSAVDRPGAYPVTAAMRTARGVVQQRGPSVFRHRRGGVRIGPLPSAGLVARAD